MVEYLVGANFLDVVNARIVGTFNDLREAEKCEKLYIRIHRTTDVRYGFNVLGSKPGWSRKWWFLYRRGLLPSQLRNSGNNLVSHLLDFGEDDEDVGLNAVENVVDDVVFDCEIFVGPSASGMDVEIVKEVEKIDLT